MKKLVLILVSAMLMTIFVAFNYLLWDKEQNTKDIKNLEYIKEDKEATINALGREIKNLEDASRELNSKINSLESINSDLQKKNDELLREQQKDRELLDRKSEIINMFKQQVDMKPLEDIVKKWAESIDKGQYEAAYKLELQHFKDNGEIVSLNEYSENYKKIIKGIKIKSIKPYNEEVEGVDSGDIVFIASLDVSKPEGSSNEQFAEGNNDKYISVTYDKDNGGWLISNIISVPAES